MREKRVVGKRAVVERSANHEGKKLISMTIEDATEYFLNLKKTKNLKEKTLAGYALNMSYFATWLNERYEGVSVSKITTEILREYIMWCAKEKQYYENHPFKQKHYQGKTGISAASINVRIRVLKVFFATLRDEEVIDRNPAEKLSLMRVDVDTVQPLTDEELQRLLASPDQRYFSQFRDYVIMLLIIDTGMRINEICSLEVKEIDFKARQIVLPAAKNKNRKLRVLPISFDTVKLLMEITAENKQHFDSSYVFLTNRGDPLNEKTVQKALVKYAEKAGLEKRVSPHVLRHNFAKMAALNGMDIFSLMRMMGHADISTTRKYVQVNDDEVKHQHFQFSPLKRLVLRK